MTVRVGAAGTDLTSTLSAGTRSSQRIIADFDGAGSLSVDATHISSSTAWSGEVSFAGAGQLSATVAGIADRAIVSWVEFEFLTPRVIAAAHVGEATFAGEGGLSAQARLALAARATFAGAGQLSVSARLRQAAAATFAGAGTLSGNATQSSGATAWSGQVRFAGVGIFSIAATTPVQLLRPDADDVDGGWTNELDGTSLVPSIDEAVVDDEDYIKSSVDPVADICRFRISDPTRIATAPMKVRVRYKRTGTGPINLTMRLQQGAVDIAEWVYSDIADEFVTAEETLTAPQFAAVTDFTNLFVELQADLASAGPTNHFVESMFAGTGNLTAQILAQEVVTQRYLPPFIFGSGAVMRRM